MSISSVFKIAVVSLTVSMTTCKHPLSQRKDDQSPSSEPIVVEHNDAPTHISLGISLGLAGAIVLDTVSEILWKAGVVNIGNSNGVVATLYGALQQPLFLVAMLLYIPKYYNWMYVLAKADLTFAKPITSLSYVTVLVFSALFLKEPITWAKVIGLALILWGVWQVSQTEAKTIQGDCHA